MPKNHHTMDENTNQILPIFSVVNGVNDPSFALVVNITDDDSTNIVAALRSFEPGIPNAIQT